MFVWNKISQLGDNWEMLPYAVGSADSWKMESMIAGGNYSLALAPSKGSSTGVRGPSRTVQVGAKPFERTLANVVANPLPEGSGVSGAWTSAQNATGFKIGTIERTHSITSRPLPYTVSATTTFWHVYPLEGGKYYQFMARPVRGFVDGVASYSNAARTPGVTSNRAYIALGDSYSSGLGAHRDVSDYDLHESCRRTTSAWAFQMQPDYLVDTELVACQGDRLDSGIDGGVRAQLASITPFFAEHPKSAQLITVTVGGNDAGFSDKLTACVTSFGSCADNETSWSREVGDLAPAIESFYDELRSVAPYADIVVGGYPVVIEIDGTSSNILCGRIGQNEREMINRLSSQMNNVITTAANASRPGPPVWSAAQRVQNRFVGHNACGPSEWIHAGTTGGGASWGVGKNSFHPNPAGQTAYAIAFSDTIVARTRPLE